MAHLFYIKFLNFQTVSKNHQQQIDQISNVYWLILDQLLLFLELDLSPNIKKEHYMMYY